MFPFKHVLIDTQRVICTAYKKGFAQVSDPWCRRAGLGRTRRISHEERTIDAYSTPDETSQNLFDSASNLSTQKEFSVVRT
jgi:hypothetical protein